MKGYTFAVESYDPSDKSLPTYLVTVDTETHERVRVAEFVSPEAVQSFWDVLNLKLLVAQERGRSGI